MNEWVDRSFICEYCGKLIIDSPDKFVSGCKHYPLPENSENIYGILFENISVEVEVNENKL